MPPTIEVVVELAVVEEIVVVVDGSYRWIEKSEIVSEKVSEIVL